MCGCRFINNSLPESEKWRVLYFFCYFYTCVTGNINAVCKDASVMGLKLIATDGRDVGRDVGCEIGCRVGCSEG